MLKAKKIIRDLEHLKGSKYFGGACECSHNGQRSYNLDIGAITLVEGLARYEIDFKRYYKVDFDDVIYEDAQGDYELCELDLKADNSYNWNAQTVFNFNQIKVDGKEYVTIKFHRYGDVRGNYTDYMVLDLTLDEFYEELLELSSVYAEVQIKNNLFEISTDIFQECGVCRIYCDALDIDTEHYLDIDNFRNKKDITKAVREWLKEYESEV